MTLSNTNILELARGDEEKTLECIFSWQLTIASDNTLHKDKK